MGGELRAEQRANDDAGTDGFHHRPIHRLMSMVRAQAHAGGKNDGGH